VNRQEPGLREFFLGIVFDRAQVPSTVSARAWERGASSRVSIMRLTAGFSARFLNFFVERWVAM